MKKQLTTVFLIFVLLLTMAGCSVASAAQKLEAAEEKLDIAEDQLEASLREAVTPAPAPTVPAAVPAETQPVPEKELSAAEKSSGKLTKEQAEQIALDYLGFTAEQVTRLRSEYEVDDRIPQFEVEFHQGDWEYEFEIHGENGQILSYDKDHKYD